MSANIELEETAGLPVDYSKIVPAENSQAYKARQTRKVLIQGATVAVMLEQKAVE